MADSTATVDLDRLEARERAGKAFDASRLSGGMFWNEWPKEAQDRLVAFAEAVAAPIIARLRRAEAALEVAELALEPFALVGELLELETTGLDDLDELELIVEGGHVFDRPMVGAYRRAHQALSTLAAAKGGEG